MDVDASMQQEYDDPATDMDTDSDDESFSAPLDPAVAAEELKKSANEFYKSGNYTEAVELYGRAIDLQPQNPTYYSNRSAARTMLKQHPLSVQDCRQALDLDPSQIKIYSRASKGLLYMGDIQAAAEMLKKGIQVAQGTPSLVEHVARLKEELASVQRVEGLIADTKTYLDSKDYGKALTAIENAMHFADPGTVKPKPGSSSSSSSKLLSADLSNISKKWKLLRAKCLLGLTEIAETQKVVSALLSADSTNSEALLLRAQVLYLNDSHPLTHIIQVLSQALAFEPDFKPARDFLKKVKALEALKKEGNELYGASNWQGAEEAYTRFLEADDIGGVVRVKVLSNRATVRSKLGKHSTAVSDSTTALETLEKLCFPTSTNPSSAAASEPTPTDEKNSTHSSLFLKLRLRRADSQTKLSNHEEALRDYAAAQQLNPTDASIQRAHQQAQQAARQAKRKDYYKILGISRDASDSEIKKAYRKLALQYHPDKQASLPEEERQESDKKFKEISEAYGVLSDPQKKNMFDSGMDVDGSSASGMGGNPFGGMGGGFGGGMDMEDILRMFHGAGGMGGGHPFMHAGGGFPGQGRSRGGGQGFGGHTFHFG
ncbi:hypothetical protein HDV05_005835 [Chytridiales sp. JEL 0842]|nr:hypothetical protein HDV05_005835 [Chytridiales sp. JEL 0842]